VLIVMRRAEEGDGIDGFAKCLKYKVIALVKPKDLLMEKERISKTGYANLQPR
jgi:hypothetical protein